MSLRMKSAVALLAFLALPAAARYKDNSVPGWNVIKGVRVGDAIQSVVDKVGNGAKANSELEVCADTDFARFRSVGGRITRIEYSCYTG